MIISKTPFRISFFGGGTDLPEWYKENSGAVLSSTIDKYVYISSRYLPEFFEYKHRVVWTKVEKVMHFDEIEHPVVKEGLKFLEFSNDIGLDIQYQADLPARSGMGSSSAFTVGFINSLMALKKKILSKKELAEKAIFLEQSVLNEIGGCQDQYACATGGFNKFRFCENGSIITEDIKIKDETIKKLEENLLLVYLGLGRFGSEIQKKVVANLSKKKKHLIRMYNMVDEGIKILNKGDSLDDFGLLLDEAWQNKKELDPIISNEKVDNVYSQAKLNGVLGGKLLGAGQTGFMILYVPKEKRTKVLKYLSKLLVVPFSFSFEGSKIMYNSAKKIND